MEDVEEEVGSKVVENPSTPRKKARTDTSTKESKPDISIKKPKMDTPTKKSDLSTPAEISSEDTPIKKGILKLRPPKNSVTKDKINMALSARIDAILEGDVDGKGEGFVEVTKGRKGRYKKIDTLAPPPRRAPSKSKKRQTRGKASSKKLSKDFDSILHQKPT